MSARSTAVAAPVLLEANTVSDCPMTVIVSSTAIVRTLNCTSVATPRLITISSSVAGSNAVPAPVKVAVTE